MGKLVEEQPKQVSVAKYNQSLEPALFQERMKLSFRSESDKNPAHGGGRQCTHNDHSPLEL